MVEKKRSVAPKSVNASKASHRLGFFKPRKFYRVGNNWQRAKARYIDLVNSHELKYSITLGNFHSRGFQDYPVKPRFRARIPRGQKLNDIEAIGSYWLVSDSAKEMLVSISGIDFAFLSIDMELTGSEKPLVYWLCDVISVLDAVDETQSDLTIGIADNGTPFYKNIVTSRLVFDESIVSIHHVFRITRQFSYVFCDEIFKEAVKKARFVGIVFEPVLGPEV